MLRRVLLLFLAVGLAFLGLGLLVTALVRQRADADKETVKKNLMELGFFAAQYQKALNQKSKLPDVVVVPPATVMPSPFPPDERLSWAVAMLPFLDQKRQKTDELISQIDVNQPCDKGSNRDVSLVKLRVVLCPAAPPPFPPDEPVVTQIVGIAGVGPDAASLPTDSPRAGSFRYDTPTPLIAFPDGTSNTLLFGETNFELGPWIRGGYSTTRGLEPAEKLIGPGMQFGGIHQNGAWFGFADGGVRFLNDRMESKILLALATRAGGTDEANAIAD